MNTNSGLTETEVQSSRPRCERILDNKSLQTQTQPADRPLKWDHPSYWKGVRIGQCASCKRLGKDVLRDGLCWLCDSLRMSEQARIKFSKT